MIDLLEYVRPIKTGGGEGQSFQGFDVFVVCDMNPRGSVNSIYNNLVSVMKIKKCQ